MLGGGVGCGTRAVSLGWGLGFHRRCSRPRCWLGEEENSVDGVGRSVRAFLVVVVVVVHQGISGLSQGVRGRGQELID